MLCMVAGVFVLGCGGEQPPAQQQATQPAENATPAASSVAASADTDSYQSKIKFKAGDGSEALIIKRYQDHDKLEINFEGSKALIKARSNAENRWKYKESTDGSDEKEQIAEIKLKDDSFKLVDTDEKLLWKVRLDEGKIKVSDNEEGNNSWEIKTKSSEKAEIRDASGAEIGNVKFYADKGKLKVKDAAESEIFVSKDLKFSAAPGVILFKHIPLKHRIVIISELLRMGR
jgi:hypothetical protein